MTLHYLQDFDVDADPLLVFVEKKEAGGNLDNEVPKIQEL